MKETFKRVWVGLVACPYIGWIIFNGFGGSIFFVVTGVLVFGLMMRELVGLVELRGYRVRRFWVFGFFLGIGLWGWVWGMGGGEFLGLAVLVLTMGVLGMGVFSGMDIGRVIEEVGVSALIVVYCGFSLFFLMRLQKEDPYNLLYIWVVTWMADIGGYFMGKVFGRHGLGIRVSPKKTVEGLLGGLVFAILGGVLLKVWIPEVYSGRRWILYSDIGMMGMSLVFGLLGVVGDLVGSLWKRWGGVKDSSGLIPGHGGVLDVMDSLVLTVPIFYGLVWVFR